jgi:hypothetical protein
VEALNMITKNFIHPLKNLITKEDKEKIFINVEELRNFHTGFFSDLQKAHKVNPSDISEVFMKYKKSFLDYGKYCALLTESQQHTETLCNKNEQIKVKISECEKEDP